MISIASSLGGFIVKCTHQEITSPGKLASAKDLVINESNLPFEGLTLPKTNWGSFVEIEDFNQGDDGVLEIDVYCRHLVEISDESTEDELLYGQTSLLEHWSELDAEPDFPLSDLANSLDEIIVQDKMLSTLYQYRPLRNQTWVIARWLELLPINMAVKGAFINKHGFEQAKGFVESIIYKS